MAQAYELGKESGEPRAIYHGLFYLAQLHYHMNSLALAEELIEQCFQHPYGAYDMFRFRQFALLGNIKYAQGSCDDAMSSITQASKLIHAESDLTYQSLFYEAKVKIQTCEGTLDSTSYFLKKVISIQDSMYYDRKENEARRIEAKYQLKSTQDSIELLSLTNEIQGAKLKDRNTSLVFGLIVLSLLSVLLFLLYNRHQYSLEEVRLSNDKLNFFSNVAHELQTPLTVISGAIQNLLKSDQKNQFFNEQLGLVERNSNALLSTVEQILSLAKMDRDIIEAVKLQQFSLKSFLHFVVEDFQFVASNKNIEIEIDGIADDSLTIISDVEKLKSILKNLLANAINGINSNGKITISYYDKVEYHGLSVTDNGPGIAEAELPRIFDRFFQAENGRSGGGFGIGLAICKEFVERLEGYISVQSTEGLGSVFRIELPKQVIQGEKLSSEILYFPEKRNIRAAPIIDDTPKHEQELVPEILIVEDNLEVCYLLKTILTKDYHLKFIYSGDEAVSYLNAHVPELIIIDWMLPVVDGIELVRNIKSDPRTSFVPVLMLTARDFLTDKLKAIRVGVDDYIQKPFDSQELQIRISRLLTARENRTEGLFEDFYEARGKERDEDKLSSKDQLWLLELEEKLQPHLSDAELDMKQISIMSDVSISKMSRKIKRLTGFTGKRYIRELRLWKARQLLETGKYRTVKEVSYAVGFKNQRYFSRIFRERFGKYPSDY